MGFMVGTALKGTSRCATLPSFLVLSLQLGVFSESVQVWWFHYEVHVHTSLGFVLLSWFVETGKSLQKCSA